MTKRRALTFIFVVCALLSMPVSRAFADDRGSDPKDVNSKLDIKQVTDRVDGRKVTYSVETYGDWDAVEDFAIMRWYFDLTGDDKYSDMCFRLQSVGDGRLRAEFYPKCGGFAWSTAEARKPAPNRVEFSVPIRDLIRGGGVDPGKPFRYKVQSEDFNGRTDWIPDRGFIDQTPLPKLAAAELRGNNTNTASQVGAGKSAGSSGAESAGGEEKGFFNRHFAAFGGLPIGWLLVATVLIVAVVALVWRSISRRLFPPVHHEFEERVRAGDR